MGKSTISMAIFNSYVSLPEGKLVHSNSDRFTRRWSLLNAPWSLWAVFSILDRTQNRHVSGCFFWSTCSPIASQTAINHCFRIQCPFLRRFHQCVCLLLFSFLIGLFTLTLTVHKPQAEAPKARSNVSDAVPWTLPTSVQKRFCNHENSMARSMQHHV